MSRSSGAFEPHPDPEAIFGRLEERYGLPPSLFAEHRLWRRNDAGTTWIAAVGWIPIEGLNLEALGLVLSKDPDAPERLAMGFIRRFGHRATRGRILLDRDAAIRFLEGGVHPMPPGAHVSNGYCIVCSPERPLGRGRIHNGALYCEVPKAFRTQPGERPRVAV